VQRLYTMFPTAGPGVGLLLLRVAVAAMLVGDPGLPPAQAWLARAVAALIAGGLATPVLAAAAAVLFLVRATDAATAALAVARGAAALSAAALTLLGPGAYSLDARRFGRRLVVTSGRDRE